MGQSNGALGGMPWWVKAVAWVGAPTVFAGALLWFVMGVLEGGLAKHAEDSEAHAQVTIDHTRAATEYFMQLAQSQGEVVYLLRIMCQNTARSATERERCVKPPAWKSVN